MIRRPPRSTRTDTLFPYTTLFRSAPTAVSASDFDMALYGLLRDDITLAEAPDKLSARVLDTLLASSRTIMRDGKVLESPNDRYERVSGRSEEHTSELQLLMRISYAVFCLKTKRI